LGTLSGLPESRVIAAGIANNFLVTCSEVQILNYIYDSHLQLKEMKEQMK